MQARINAMMTAFERLSAREQGMVLFLALAFIGVIFGFGGFLVNRNLEARQKRIEVKADKLREIAALRGDYQRRLADQNRLATEVKGNSSMRILSYLEDLAKKSGIDLQNATERPNNPTGSDQVKEETAEVMVQNVSIDRLHEFLRMIENGNQLVKVRQLKIKTRFDNKEMLDASVTVGTYKPATGGSSG